MAGYNKIYVIGGEGGFQGSDGVMPIFYQILAGVGSRRWMEPHYFDESIKPLGNIKSIVPVSPEDDALFDAVLAFGPSYFDECPSMAIVRAKLQGVEQLDFNAESNQVPAEWQTLRNEAWELFSKMSIWLADLKPFRI